MKWYLAKLVYQIVCGDGNHTPQFDEQLRVVMADDELHAFQKARSIGEREQDDFFNTQNKPVRWKFIDVPELYAMNTMVDGAEMYSKIREEDSADIYIRVTQMKAAHLLESSAHACIRLN